MIGKLRSADEELRFALEKLRSTKITLKQQQEKVKNEKQHEGIMTDDVINVMDNRNRNILMSIGYHRVRRLQGNGSA